MIFSDGSSSVFAPPPEKGRLQQPLGVVSGYWSAARLALFSPMNDTLVRAILDLAVFLEFADDQTVDPDAAIEALEQLSSTLMGMDPADQIAFTTSVGQLASQYGDAEVSEFVRSLPSAFGLGSS
jgi:hypothetical protein